MKFNELKAVAHGFYADKDRIGVLQELIRYSDQDIMDMFGLEQAA